MKNLLFAFSTVFIFVSSGCDITGGNSNTEDLSNKVCVFRTDICNMSIAEVEDGKVKRLAPRGVDASGSSCNNENIKPNEFTEVADQLCQVSGTNCIDRNASVTDGSYVFSNAAGSIKDFCSKLSPKDCLKTALPAGSPISNFSDLDEINQNSGQLCQLKSKS